jgi:hypothetical protein
MPVELVVEHILTTIVIGGVFLGLAFSPLPRAWAHRIMHGKRADQPLEDPRVDDLVEDNAMLRRQLDEMQERIEFAERMLAQQQAREKLPGNRA